MSSDKHEYDGIEEHDNPLPLWWLITFFGTIIFSFIYYIHYTSGTGMTLAQELEADMKNLPQVADKAWTDEELESLFNSKENQNLGLALYTTKCSACHGAEGQGTIGPNLTDKFWINGKGHRNEILNVIREGIVEKGMPAWEEVLSEDETIQVSAYVYSLKGTKPANPKAPQGQEAP